ncbi:DUF1269 domain-containing protein [Candidatus Saccharibacteria bacterium]|nr:DUF1269 domain-containing protein [Candidatus Saccharibacteria bacterium]
MLGPIDYIIVGFEGNKFDGSILKAIGEAIDSGIIRLVDLLLISKDAEGNVKELNIADLGDAYSVDFLEKNKSGDRKITEEDVSEMADLLENNTSAGMLVVEQLWAKPLKQAILNANGVLVAEGRIHPDASAELESKEG